MNKIQKVILGIVSVLVIVLCIGQFKGSSGKVGDATVENFPVWFYNGLVIGQQNTLLNQLTFGTCNLVGATSMATLTNAALTCAAPGVKVGDKVFMTSTNAGVGATVNSGFPIIGATVSSAGVITATLVNSTGGTNTPAGGSITGIQYLDLR